MGTTKEIIAELIAQGLTNKEISEKTGINYNTVYSHARDIRKLAAVGGIGRNADRHLCRKCKFRNEHFGICDYIGQTGEARGCKASDCNKYEKGRPVKRRARKAVVSQSR